MVIDTSMKCDMAEQDDYCQAKESNRAREIAIDNVIRSDFQTFQHFYYFQE